MNANDYKQMLINAYKDQELSVEDFENTLAHFAGLCVKENNKMNLKQELIDRLGVPENWDKYDYQTQRYSFDDMQEVLEDIVEKLTITDIVGQIEQLLALAQYMCEHQNNLDGKTAEDYLQDFLSQ